jgi:hypothetical protein
MWVVLPVGSLRGRACRVSNVLTCVRSHLSFRRQARWLG